MGSDCFGTAFLTTSATQGLEIACRLSLGPGDEVVLSSFSHPSCTNAVILAGGVPVYCDISSETLNLDTASARESFTAKTKAVLPIYYGGVTDEQSWLTYVAPHRGLTLIEDAAHCVFNYRLGGDFGVISFHSTKNVETGEGGVLLVSEKRRKEVEIYLDFGTDRAGMIRGEKGFYSHRGLGTSGRMSSYLAERLYPQLIGFQPITQRRQNAWKVYSNEIKAFSKAGKPGNGHIFWFLNDNRDVVIQKLRDRGIKAASHFEAAHLTPVGRRYGRVHSAITVAQDVAERIIRLPTDVTEAEARNISLTVNEVIGASL